MKQALAVFLLLAGSIVSYGQASYATVTGTVVDGHSNPYAYARLSATLVSSTGVPLKYVYFADGSRYVIPPVNAVLGSDGAFSVSVLKNSSVSNPTGTKWQFTIGDPNQPGVVLTYSPSWSITYSASITADVSLSTPLNALAQDLTFVNLQTGQSTLGGGGGTPTALSPNPTHVGQMWSWLPGAAPNQGWSDLMAQWYNPYDYGAAGDGTTNDDAAFTLMSAAALASAKPYNIMLMPRTGPFVLTTPVDFSGANIVFASYDPTFTGTILYNGVDAGPAITMAQNTFGSFVAVRGTSTAAQTIVKFTDGYAEDLEVYSADASNDFVSVDFEGHFAGAILETISTDSPVNIASSVKVDIKGGSVNNQSMSMVTTDPFVIGSNSTLTLGTVSIYSHNTANTAACMIKLPDYHDNYGTLKNVRFLPSVGYTGHILCGPTGAITSGVPMINGTISGYYDAALLFSGKLGGTIQMQGNLVASLENSGIVFTNGIATQGLFYSAAGVALPTPAFPGPITSYVSDQTTACTGTYTSGGAVKCKVWWDGSGWKAF